jgi:hypothetical protein
MASAADWISTEARFPPSGQTVHVRTKYETVPHTMTFYESPTPRWEGANLVFDPEYFAYWKPIAERSRLTKGH